MILVLDKYWVFKIVVVGVEKIKEYLKKKYILENIFDFVVDVDLIG